MNKPLLLLFLGLLILPSAFAACPGGPNQLIFRISGTTNAHAELWNGAGNYATEICYDTIFGSAYAGTLPHSGLTVLKASAATNAHVEQSNQANYPANISYGNLVCTYGAACDTVAGEKCIATISAATNAHVSSLCTGAGSYSLKVCCKDTTNALPTANAGLDQPASTGSPVSLIGNCSDSDGTISDCDWAAAPAGCVFEGPQSKSVMGNATASSSVSAACSGPIGNSFTFTLTAKDNDDDTSSDEMLVTIQAPANMLPVAEAGGPYETTLPSFSINLDGSGSTDAEDCPSGGDSCTGLSYSWEILNNAANCIPLSRSGIKPPAITCTQAGESTATLKVTDSGGLFDLDSANIIVYVAAGSGPYLRLTKIDVAPENFGAGTALNFTRLDVAIKNFGDTTNALINVKVFGATDFSMVDGTEFASVQANCDSLGNNPLGCEKSLKTINVSSLSPGSYKLVVKAFDGAGIEHDSKSVFFTVISPVPVPELGFVFVPLLAVSALAIMFFAGKSGKAKK